eukprot:4808057-Prymnesium_polylepis.1
MMLEVQKYSKGQVVRQQGSQASTLLVIRKGKIKISVQVDGVDVPLSELCAAPRPRRTRTLHPPPARPNGPLSLAPAQRA